MLHKRSLTALMVTALTVTALMVGSAAAFDDSKYPDWSGQWMRPSGVGTQWDQTKPSGLAQHAPLTSEYQARLAASVSDQARGGQGEDSRVSCITAGMPRIMTGTRPFELVVLPAVTYVYGEGNMPRRIYTDGRSIPTNEEPTYMGYSIGKWIDANGDGRHPIYAELTEVADGEGKAGDIMWNFEKFVVAPSGEVVGRFRPRTEPEDAAIVEAITANLPA